MSSDRVGNRAVAATCALSLIDRGGLSGLVFTATSRGRNGMSDNTESAILAGGCFWVVQEVLRHLDGVISSRVGYTGGENDNPTEGSHPGHAEAVEVVFDPERITYRGLLEFFLQSHRPDLGKRVVGSDYRSEIFYTGDAQRQVAEETIADIDALGIWPGKLVTEVSQAGIFWEAEAEDQDYLQRYQKQRSTALDNRE
jgi:peptide-methionine (S)-S-oxide reductase